jgi:hypothetical protein
VLYIISRFDLDNAAASRINIRAKLFNGAARHRYLVSRASAIFIAIARIKLDAEISARAFVRQRNYCQRARAEHVFGITDAMYRK